MPTQPARRGRFITVEGIDGAGTSTHVGWIKELIERRGERVWLTREPGGTPVGERLREVLLHEPMAPLSEALLMFAARYEHCQREIWPRLDRGMWIVCDRFSDATYAYQGGGHRVPEDILVRIETLLLRDFRPDLSLLFDVPVAVALERLAKGRSLDKFERQQPDFFNRVREAYLARGRAEPERFRLIDSTQAVAAVRARIEAIIAET